MVPVSVVSSMRVVVVVTGTSVGDSVDSVLVENRVPSG